MPACYFLSFFRNSQIPAELRNLYELSNTTHGVSSFLLASPATNFLLIFQLATGRVSIEIVLAESTDLTKKLVFEFLFRFVFD
jgi:hypothetical protein